MGNEISEKNKSIIQLDKLISKSRLHFYKPIQIAEILFHHRTEKKINLKQLETYRNLSKKWRDEITQKLVGSISTSSQKFQDNIFESNAIPPDVLNELGILNQKDGSIEKHIYTSISSKFKNLEKIIKYCENEKEFNLKVLLDTARSDNDLKRSVDKIYEVIVYSLISEVLKDIKLSLSLNVKLDDLKKYKKYSNTFLNFKTKKDIKSRVFRAGVANAADGGIDLWSNFGWLIQVKHLLLDEENFKKILKNQECEKIIIICRDTDFNFKNYLKKLSNKNVTVLVEKDLIELSNIIVSNENLKKNYLNNIIINLKKEFPMIGNKEYLNKFFQTRGYQKNKKEIN